MDLNSNLPKKMNRRTTYAQFQKLVDQMEAFPHLATGNPVFKCTKSEVDTVWDTIAQSLNSIGPPERTVLEWKKTWADLKSRAKQNIAENNRSFSGTGGGPCRIKTLTALELQIEKICHLSSAAAPEGPVQGLKCAILNPISNYDESPPRTSHKLAVVTPTGSSELNLAQKSASLFSTRISTAETSPIFIPNSNTMSTPLPTSSPKQMSKILKRKRKHYEATKENEELELLRKQVVTQEAILRAMESQAKSAESQLKYAELQVKSAEEQAKAMRDSAESAKLIAKTLSDLMQYLN